MKKSQFCLVVLGIVASCVMFALAAPRNLTSEASPFSASKAVTLKNPRYVTKPIEEIKVGDRVLTYAGRPDLDECVATDSLVVQLRLENDDSQYEVRLIRPQSWFQEHSVRPGSRVRLDTRQMVGDFLVVTVQECPRIKPGAGRVVTGTFSHRHKGLLQLGIGGETIGVTSEHPFYSRTRGRFTKAGSLHVGEELVCWNGCQKIENIEVNDAHAVVYNLEVEGDHVYRVGKHGILVHNDCFDVAEELLESMGGEIRVIQPIRGPRVPTPPRYPVGGQPDPPFGSHAIHLLDDVVRDPATQSGQPFREWLQEYASGHNMTVAQLLQEVAITRWFPGMPKPRL